MSSAPIQFAVTSPDLPSLRKRQSTAHCLSLTGIPHTGRKDADEVSILPIPVTTTITRAMGAELIF